MYFRTGAPLTTIMPPDDTPKCASVLTTIAAGSSAVRPLPIRSAYRVAGPSPGPHLLVLGGIHGHEPAGYEAIKNLIGLFANGDLKLSRGTLTLAIGNEEALMRDKKEITKNLNRIFSDISFENPACYEERRVEELKSLMAEAEILLDIHQTSRPSPPFLMCERHHLSEALRMGFDTIVTGWGEVSDPGNEGDTETYMNRIGKKGFTYEAGERGCTEGTAHAVNATMRMLAHYRLVDATYEPAITATVYEMLHSSSAEAGSTFEYASALNSFQPLASGELICRDSRREHRAPCDCVLLMPNAYDFKLAKKTALSGSPTLPSPRQPL